MTFMFTFLKRDKSLFMIYKCPKTDITANK